jgi:predicted DCC family thiol-disulfide oxidoreductase YuxK
MKLTQQGLPPGLSYDDKVILFDGVCKLCNAWSNFIIRHDKNHYFKLASVQSTQGQQILQHFGYPTDVYETMLVVHSGVCLEKSDAFFYVMKALGYPWRLANCLQFLPASFRHWLYDRIALNRYRLFGKYDYCALPAADHDKRFLDGS